MESSESSEEREPNITIPKRTYKLPEKADERDKQKNQQPAKNNRRAGNIGPSVSREKRQLRSANSK